VRFGSFYCPAGRLSWGLVAGDFMLDFGNLPLEGCQDLRSALGKARWGELERAIPAAPRLEIATLRWAPVIPNPSKILCIGLNYESHRWETGRPPQRYPAVFARYANSQTGHLRAVPLTPLSTALDYEGELAVVIGKAGRYVPRHDALQYVGGYTCYNDMTLRDWQSHTHQFTPGKNFPGTGAFGPWLVTADELGDIGDLRLQTRVNGEVRQSALLGEMIFDVPRLIEYCSSFTDLQPGDVIVTGTPAGIGARRNPPSWLEPADVVEIEIEKIGVLRNTIVNESGAASPSAGGQHEANLT
jgi:2-keto-4-pentenoate hydratase/2-oxohepta-3-ene-1,7-dioic acid hydratase in catechol pathway